ncbi:sulfite reductase subunit alpha [bacterium]|nr:MAG: sulfite reductase subunit alpha [bacterium]
MSTPVVYNRKNPFYASLSRMELLTKEGSSKDTRHFEIDLSGSGIAYEPGDSLAIQAQNDPALVRSLIDLIGGDPEQAVGEKTLFDVLSNDLTITEPGGKLLDAIKAETPGSSFEAAMGDPVEKSRYLYGRDVLDILEEHPEVKFTPETLVPLLKPLQVRLYSISSSLAACPESVHLTVATVKYESHGRERGGVASTWLAHRLEEHTKIPVYIQPNKRFRLPAPESEAPVIFCGPGTGVAPFRAFVQERGVTGAKGKAWLFFGEQHRNSEFFYEEEWNEALKTGALTKLTTAFSRDQAHKIYVQHTMLEEGEEFWKWLDAGAIFYVCGDKTRMATDVDAALHQIIEQFGGKTDEEAKAYVEAMKKEHRYHRDVY